MMKTKEQIREEFLTKFKTLLAEYNAEIQCSDFYDGYPECGQDIRMIVDIPGTYDNDHNCLSEWTEIDLGSYVHKDIAK